VNNGSSGILVIGPGSEAIGNYCIRNNTANNADDAGICVLDANNRVEDNHVSASGYAGILVQSVGNNIIIKNSVSGNGTKNYSGIAGNVVGPIITNTVSGIITNSNPWANFSF
jgi:parallel beta-helix repeat protein